MFIKKFKIMKSFLLTLMIIGISIASTALTVYAGTDGNELKTTNHPDKLIIQLGSDCAGAEFELKLDSSIFPVPLKANSSGVITMELGGSKTYTLTRLIPAAVPQQSAATSVSSSTNQTVANIPTSEIETTIIESEISNEIDTAEPVFAIETSESVENSVPVVPLILFFIGLILAVAGLLFMRALKKRRSYYDDEDDEDDKEE